MGSPSYHANETKQRELDYEERKQKPLLDQRNKVNQGVYNKNKKAIDIFQNKLRSDVNAQFKMRGLDPKSNDPAVRKILESIVGRAKSKNDKYMRSLGIRTNMPRPKQRPTGTPVPTAVANPVPKRRPTGDPVPKAKESPASIMARRKRQAEARKRRDEERKINKKVGDVTIYNPRVKKQMEAIQRKQKEIPNWAKPAIKSKSKLPKQKTKLTTATQKGIPPSAIKQMQDANKKMQAKVFGGGKKPTSKRTFART